MQKDSGFRRIPLGCSAALFRKKLSGSRSIRSKSPHPTFPGCHPNSSRWCHFPTAKGTVSPLRPSAIACTVLRRGDENGSPINPNWTRPQHILSADKNFYRPAKFTNWPLWCSKRYIAPVKDLGQLAFDDIQGLVLPWAVTALGGVCYRLSIGSGSLSPFRRPNLEGPIWKALAGRLSSRKIAGEIKDRAHVGDAMWPRPEILGFLLL